MRIKIHYRHITHSENLSQNIIKWLQQQLHLGKFAHHLQVDMFFSKATPSTKANAVLFECHLRARAPWLSREIFLKDSDEDFWKLVMNCGELLNKQINRDIRQKRNERRQSHKWPSLTG